MSRFRLLASRMPWLRGGDTRHLEELNTVRESAQKCEDLLHEKREKNLCR